MIPHRHGQYRYTLKHFAFKSARIPRVMHLFENISSAPFILFAPLFVIVSLEMSRHLVPMFLYSESVTESSFSGNGGYKLLFSKINSASVRAATDYAKMKAGMYEIMSMICEKSREKRFDRYSIISKGILYMESEDGENLSIPETAALCNVSEGYFRRLFKEYSGLSPSDYRLRHKIKRAMLLLKYENMTVSEIAESLSFTSSAYFIKTFRRTTGTTPFKYRSSFL